MMTLTALIMAGGRGERFWPKSRKKSPKQTLTLFNGQPLINSALNLLTPVISQERIFIVTEKSVAKPICAVLPQTFPAKNLIIEPMGRNTAACIGLGTVYITQKYPDAIIAVICADHLIPDGDSFRQHLLLAVQIAEQHDYLVTFGINPSYPETGFGYIASGDMLLTSNGLSVYRVKRFIEKPDKPTAERYVVSGTYFWNSGMFVWRASTILAQIQRFMPQLYNGLQKIQSVIGTPQEQSVIHAVYRNLDKIPIDKGIMEKSDRVAVVKSIFPWSDIGSWLTLDLIREKNGDGNVALGDYLGIDTKNNIIVSDNQLVAAIGIKDMVVVATKDVVLICPKERTQEVKQIVTQLASDPKYGRYL
ncbi:MAG: sugar phosphate nucleotidyltransferase [bacterium]|nr:sugar phosphate nucleotidyltransferase [bacterium]